MDASVILERARELRLLVVGDVMLDHYLWGDADRISPEAPVPVVAVHRDTWVAGGAANVAHNLVTLGARAELAGGIGRDDAGRRLLALLRRQKVAFDRELFSGPARPTIVKTRVIARTQQLCRLDREAAPEDYALDLAQLGGALDAKVAAADAVILSDYAKGTLSSALVERVIATAARRGTLVALDPKPKNALRYHSPGLMTPNRKEAMQLAGLAEWDAAEACRRIFRRYRPKHLVITLGEHGMLLSQGGRVQREMPTLAREVFDVSGAGDTAIAAITLALAAGADLAAAAHFGNAAAGVVVAKVGTATVTPDELLQHLAAGA